MQELHAPALAPIFAAMAALDDAVAAHKLVVERLAFESSRAERLDEELRRVDLHQHEALAGAAQKLAHAIGLVERLSREERRARLDIQRAQTILEGVRRGEHRDQFERLRIELEIDAASIWDLVGQFERQMRARLEQHAELAGELGFIARAAGEPQLQAPEMTSWAPALGTSGPELLDAVASSVRHRQEQGIALVQVARLKPEPAREVLKTVEGKRVDRNPEVARPTLEVSAPAPASPALRLGFGIDHATRPAARPPAPSPQRSAPPADPRGRIQRALSKFLGTADSKPPRVKP